MFRIDVGQSEYRTVMSRHPLLGPGTGLARLRPRSLVSKGSMSCLTERVFTKLFL